MPLPRQSSRNSNRFQVGDPDIVTSLLMNEEKTAESSEVQVKTHETEFGVDVKNKKLKKKKSKTRINREDTVMQGSFNRLFEAIASDDLSMVRAIIGKNYAILKETGEHGATVLHQATRHGSILTLEYLISKVADINVTNEQNCSAIHIAVEFSEIKALRLLLASGCDPNTNNLDGKAPLHIAVENNDLDILEALLEHKGIIPIIGDEGGSTPLHYAACFDHSKCAEILLKHGAKLCAKCKNGFYPLHLAAQGGKTDTLEVLIKYAERCGYKREDILKFTDSTQNMPLHAAVLGGNIEAVKTCLSAGAMIDAVQADQQTPIHLAAAQGTLDLIQLMFEAQKDRGKTALNLQDLSEMTPLHKAAMFDRVFVAEYLIEQGADIHIRDCMERSPLLVAAERKSWNTIKLLLRSGADITMRDKHQSNVLHLIIRNGGKPEQFKGCFCKCREESVRLLNEADQYGYTPLHYACKGGFVSTISQLLALGASITAKTKSKESPLHFAAKYGRYNTCLRLLEDCKDSCTINEADENGYTPLLLAAANGHTRVVQMLLKRGAAAVYRNHKGNTCLHLAAENGYTDTLSVIHSVHASLLDVQNKAGDTPLHVAAMEGRARVVDLLLSLEAKFLRNHESLTFMDAAIKLEQKDVCAAVVSHNRWTEALTMCSRLFGCPVLGLVKHLPEVCEMVLDRSKTSSSCDPKSKEFHYTYDFNYLQLSLEKVRKLREAGEDYMPLVALNKMVEYGRVDCLNHPVCRQFILMKWRAYGLWFYMMNLSLYLIFLISLTVFITCYSSTIHDDYRQPQASAGNASKDPEKTHKKMFQLESNHKILVIIIMIFCVMNVLKEILQMIQQRLKYFKDVTNLLEWVLYVSSALFISPFIVNISTHIQWQFGAIAVFLAWFNLLLFLQRLDFFGIYVVMFQQILKTILQCLSVFFILIVAFGLSFYIIMAGEGSIAFTTPAISLVTTGVMMLGSIDYLDGWVIPYSDKDPSTLHFSSLSFVILVLFILLMPILLMNLLIGLAVGDIEAVQRDAKLRRLAMQVELHTDIERKIPHRLLEMVDKDNMKIYPNAPCGSSFIQRVWNSVRRSSDFMSQSNGQEDGSASHDYIYEELHKQKIRMKQFATNLDKQYELIRLIVQKMEIQTEADDADEGDSTNRGPSGSTKRPIIGWSSPTIRRTLMKQTAVLQRLSKH